MNPWTLTSLVVIGFCTQLYLFGYLYRLWVALCARYSFYGVRDELIQLVADGVIREDDPVFQNFYNWSNMLAKDARMLNISILIKSLTQTTPDNPDVKLLMKLVEKSDPLVKAVVARFTYEIATSIVRSAIPIMLVLFTLVRIFKFIPHLMSRGESIENRCWQIKVSSDMRTAGSWRAQSCQLTKHAA